MFQTRIFPRLPEEQIDAIIHVYDVYGIDGHNPHAHIDGCWSSHVEKGTKSFVITVQKVDKYTRYVGLSLSRVLNCLVFIVVLFDVVVVVFLFDVVVVVDLTVAFRHRIQREQAQCKKLRDFHRTDPYVSSALN